MANEGKPKFEIPWATLLPVIAALAGVIAQFRPLTSARPSIPNGKPIEYTAAQDVDARLWQDPLSVAEKSKEQLEADLSHTDVASSRVEKHLLPALVKLVHQETEQGCVLLLAVMLDAGPYIEQEESRLRARQAVLEGLNASGFVPNDSEHIGYVTIPGQKVEVWQKKKEPWVDDGAILIPWEECRANDSGEPVHPPEARRVFVLWLPSSSFDSRPLETLATKLVGPFRQAIAANLEVKLLGPANSTGLQAMVHEGPAPDTAGPNLYAILDGLQIISPRATASDAALLDGPGSVENIIRSYLPNALEGGIQFRRTVQTDDLVLERLIEELKVRQVQVEPHLQDGHWEDGDRVVVLTDWDNPYGRSLAHTFAEKASGNRSEPNAPDPMIKPDGKSARPAVNFYHYMHGIDGRLPGDPAKATDSSAKSATQNTASSEATEGVDRSDFLRRLAQELKRTDSSLWREGKPGVRAIGLLGSDVFDKLMILRALRPEFPDALFFTNNFDAHFEREDDRSDVRNLIVASPFGGTIAPIATGTELEPFRQDVAPFRDSNQTAMFFGTLVATGRLSDAVRRMELASQPRLFEIGRHGSLELSQAILGHVSSSSGNEDFFWFRDWLSHLRSIWPLVLSAVALLLLTAWISLSIVDRSPEGGGTLRDRIKKVATSTPFLLICGVPVIVVAVSLFSQTPKGIAEPLTFFSGVSIWPTEMLRLIALMLAVHFMLKAHLDLQLNEHRITRHFFPGTKVAEPWRIDLGLHRWQAEHPTWVTGGTKFPAATAWAAYLQRNQFWPRFIRVAALTLMYFVFAVGVFFLFPRVPVPARGDLAFSADHLVLFSAVLATMVLTFYVVDAIRLNSNLIRLLTRNETQWGMPLSVGEGLVPPLEEGEFDRYYDISFVAQRTEAVAPLIWYPLVVVAISLVARSSVFDHWTWPLNLILIFTANAAWAFGSALFLSRSAEQLRAAAIRNLQLLRLKSYDNSKKREALDELIGNVRGIRAGAFAPLSEQPFIRAIIYPSGGLGLLAVAQRLLDIF